MPTSAVPAKSEIHECGREWISADMVHKDGNYHRKCLHGQKIRTTDLQGVDFIDCDLSDTEWQVGVNLQYAVFEHADLTGAKLIKANLQKARLGDAVLICADLRKTDLSQADMRKCVMYDANLEGTIFNHTALDSSSLGRCVLQDKKESQPRQDTSTRRGQEGDDSRDGKGPGRAVSGDLRRLDVALNIYRTLKHNFRDIEEYDSSGWAYFHEREILRKKSAPWAAVRNYPNEFKAKGLGLLRTYAKHHGRYLLWTIQAYTSGYGQRPLRTIGFALLAVPIFAVLYWLTAGLLSAQPLGWQDYLAFSASMLLRLDLSLNATQIQAAGPAFVLAQLESALGLGLFAVFANALGQAGR
jgi:hypothetical protein